MSLLWFRVSVCLRFSKAYTKRYTNNFLLSCENKNFPCLNWLITSFRTNISCFRFWWKTHTKSSANGYVISRVKNFLCLHIAVNQALFNFRTLPHFNLFIGKKFFSYHICSGNLENIQESRERQNWKIC